MLAPYPGEPPVRGGQAGMNTVNDGGAPMPRCCATINDPANPSSVLVFVEVNSAPDQASVDAGLQAAGAAAQAAFEAANPGQAAPPVKTFKVNGSTTHIAIDLTTF